MEADSTVPSGPRPLPDAAALLLRQVDTQPALTAHLLIVHDVAAQIIERITQTWPRTKFNHADVLFGAAIHDIGKVVFPDALEDQGNRHESAGRTLLVDMGVSATRARFTETHNRWRNDSSLLLEDLLVALADTVWAGGRDADLEYRVAASLAAAGAGDVWDIFSALDPILEEITAAGDIRLAWQARFETKP